MNYDVDAYLEVSRTLSSASDRELSELAYAAIERVDAQIGLLSGSKTERVGAWIRNSLVAACNEAGEHGRNLIQSLNDERVRNDLALVAAVAAALAKFAGFEGIPVEQVVALSLLVAILYEPTS